MKTETKQYGHFWFMQDTPDAICKLVNELYHNKKRVRFFFGYGDTGLDWNEENDVMGTIGKSTGTKPIALLIHNSRSLGGGALLTDCIVKVVDITTRRVLYQHPTYFCRTLNVDTGKDAELPHAVTRVEDGQLMAQFKTHAQAERYVAYMRGERFTL